nr:unnamed protein product [Digitaria exilis]
MVTAFPGQALAAPHNISELLCIHGKEQAAAPRHSTRPERIIAHGLTSRHVTLGHAAMDGTWVDRVLNARRTAGGWVRKKSRQLCSGVHVCSVVVGLGSQLMSAGRRSQARRRSARRLRRVATARPPGVAWPEGERV